jgi:site-specific recombinase XerD
MVETKPFTNADLQKIRQHLSQHAGQVYCFEGREKGLPYPLRTIQKIYDNTVVKSGIQRQGGIHSLRHSLRHFGRLLCKKTSKKLKI